MLHPLNPRAFGNIALLASYLTTLSERTASQVRKFRRGFKLLAGRRPADDGPRGVSALAQPEAPSAVGSALENDAAHAASGVEQALLIESSQLAELGWTPGRNPERVALVGMPEHRVRAVANATRRIALEITDPEVRVCRDGVVPPGARVPFSRSRFGGVYDALGGLVPGSDVIRGVPGERIVGAFAEHSVSPEATQDEDIVYGGMAFDHFGHFVLESLSRLWPRDVRQVRLPIYVQTEGSELPPVARRFYELAGVVDLVHPIRESTRFRHVIVPTPAFWIRNRAHVAYKTLTLSMAERALHGQRIRLSDQPLYLSRTRLADNRRRVFGEDILEAGLRKSGVLVVHPQEHDIAEQIRLLNSHRTIIATLGSALHMLLFSMMSNRVIALTRDTPSASYLLCDSLNCTQATYVRATHMPGPFPARGLTLSRMPELLDVSKAASALSEFGLKVNGHVSRQRREELKRAYRRQFVLSALRDIASRKRREELRRAKPAVEREFGDDAEVASLFVKAQKACEDWRPSDGSDGDRKADGDKEAKAEG